MQRVILPDYIFGHKKPKQQEGIEADLMLSIDLVRKGVSVGHIYETGMSTLVVLKKEWPSIN